MRSAASGRVTDDAQCRTSPGQRCSGLFFWARRLAVDAVTATCRPAVRWSTGRARRSARPGDDDARHRRATARAAMSARGAKARAVATYDAASTTTTIRRTASGRASGIGPSNASTRRSAPRCSTSAAAAAPRRWQPPSGSGPDGTVLGIDLAERRLGWRARRPRPVASITSSSGSAISSSRASPTRPSTRSSASSACSSCRTWPPRCARGGASSVPAAASPSPPAVRASSSRDRASSGKRSKTSGPASSGRSILGIASRDPASRRRHRADGGRVLGRAQVRHGLDGCQLLTPAGVMRAHRVAPVCRRTPDRDCKLSIRAATSSSSARPWPRSASTRARRLHGGWMYERHDVDTPPSTSEGTTTRCG